MSMVKEWAVKVKPEKLFKGWKVFEVVRGGRLQNICGKCYSVPEDTWIHEWVYRSDAHKAMDTRAYFGFHFYRFKRGAIKRMKMLKGIFPQDSRFNLRRVEALGVIRKGKGLVSSDGSKMAKVLVATQIKVKRG